MARVGRGNPALVVVALLLCAGTVAGAPYLQHQGDAARTGLLLDPGPDAWDVAFTIRLPGPVVPRSSLVVLDDHAYAVLERTDGQTSPDRPIPYMIGTNALVRVDLATTRIETLAALEGPPSALASDGQRLFVVGPEAIVAYTLDGEPLWDWPYPGLLGSSARTTCVPPAVESGRLYTACRREARPVEPEALPVTSVFAVSLEAANGEEHWLWVNMDTEGATLPGAGEVESPRESRFRPGNVALVGDRLAIVGHTTVGGAPGGLAWPGTFTYEGTQVVGLDATTGEEQWEQYWSGVLRSASEPTSRLPSNAPHGAVASNGDLLYVLGWDLHALDPATGDVRWTLVLESIEAARSEPVVSRYTGSGLAIDGSTVYATGFSALHAVSVQGPEPELQWSSPLPFSDWEDAHALLVAGGHAYSSTWSQHLLAFETETGRLAFSELDLPSGSNTPLQIAVADGLLVVASTVEGTVVVLGRTRASISLEVAELDPYPPAGAPVVVDASASRPGLLAPDLEFRVDWGDGSVAPWTAGTRLEHTYGIEGPVRLLVEARNSAGQTATRWFDLHVGGTPPRDPTVLQRAVDPDNYDLTFGILGLALALGGGLFAVTRARTRRHRVQRELDALEHAFVETRDRLRDCEAALAERRARVRGLGLDGKLDQAEVLLLERRIDELARELRLGTLEHQFHFLPYGFVMSLREMLEDGSISVWEREHLVRAIDADRGMTAKQKRLVKALVEEWAARDEGGAG